MVVHIQNSTAKLQVAIDQKIPFGRKNIDFFGSEFDLMIRPYLEELSMKFRLAATALTAPTKKF